MHGDLVGLAAITTRLRADCPQMAVELQAYWPRIQATFEEAARVGEDPDAAQRVTTELEKYSARATAVQEAISADLAGCRDDESVRAAMRAMPTL